MSYLSVMKKHRDKPLIPITHPLVENYAETHTTPESEQLAALLKSSSSSLKYVDMISGRVVGGLLKILVLASGAKRVLEVGTFTGYSALLMAEALPADGEVITLEMNQKYIDLALKHIRTSEHGRKIKLVAGDARKTMPAAEGEFDLIFIDGDKLSYRHYYETALQKVRKNGLIVIDNVLWDATVLEPGDEKAKYIAEFNDYVHSDARVEKVMLPVRDGVYILCKI